MDKVIIMLVDAANSSRKFECNTVTGKGPFDEMVSRSIEIEFKSRGLLRQLNIAREVRLSV